MLPLTFDFATTYSVPPGGSMTGVPVIPTSGTRSLQPRFEELFTVVPPAGIKLTFAYTVPTSASMAYTLSCSVTT